MPITAFNQEGITYENSRSVYHIKTAYEKLNQLSPDVLEDKEGNETLIPPFHQDFYDYWQSSLPLSMIGRALLFQRQLHDLFHPYDARFVGWPGIPVSEVGDWPTISTFSNDQVLERTMTLCEVNDHPEVLNGLYADQFRLAKDKDEKSHHYPVFKAFLRELWSRLIFFHPLICLTVVYEKRKEIVPKSEQQFVWRLYHNELRIINEWLLFDNLIDITQYRLPRAKIQQFLRGIASIKFIRLLYGHHLKVNPGLFKTVGTFTWPFYVAGKIADILNQYSKGNITSWVAQERLRELRTHLKKESEYEAEHNDLSNN